MHVGDPSMNTDRIAPHHENSAHIKAYKLTSPQLKMEMEKAVSIKVSKALPRGELTEAYSVRRNLVKREAMCEPTSRHIPPFQFSPFLKTEKNDEAMAIMLLRE